MPVQTAVGAPAMTKTPGICRNAAGCALAKRGRIVQVELKQPFLCPSCGGPLAPPPVRNMPEPTVLAAGAGVIVVVAGALAFWLLGSKPAPVPVHAPPPAAHPAPAPKPVAPATPPPPISENGSSGPGGPTTVVIPPQLLAPGTTTLAPATPPAAVPAAPPPAPSPPKRREHRVVASARASQKAPPPPEMKALDGSHPEYPDAYEDTDTKGQVTVTCIVQPDGSATKCQILHQTGGAAFGNAVLHWLARDTTRFPPLLRKGHPAALPFTWNIDFFP